MTVVLSSFKITGWSPNDRPTFLYFPGTGTTSFNITSTFSLVRSPNVATYPKQLQIFTQLPNFSKPILHQPTFSHCAFDGLWVSGFSIIPGEEAPGILCVSDLSRRWVVERERERRLWHRSISSWNHEWSCIIITSTARRRVAFWAWLSDLILKCLSALVGARTWNVEDWFMQAC